MTTEEQKEISRLKEENEKLKENLELSKKSMLNLLAWDKSIEEVNARNTKLQSLNAELVEALERSIDGLEWNIEDHPQHMEKADYEHLDYLKSLLQKAKDL